MKNRQTLLKVLIALSVTYNKFPPIKNAEKLDILWVSSIGKNLLPFLGAFTSNLFTIKI